jgi:hypothetical protein
VARLRAVLRFPAHIHELLFRDVRQPLRDAPEHFAVLEWYTPFARHGRDPDSRLHKIGRSFVEQGGQRQPELGIVDVLDLRRSCHLTPDFGRADVDRAVTSNTALDRFDTFYLNEFVDKHAYRTM